MANTAQAPSSSEKVAPGSTAKSVDVTKAHGIEVGEKMYQEVGGHPPRKDSAEFVKARTTLHAILKELGDNFYGHGDGDDQVQAHHGGSIWVRTDDEKWMMVLNIVGIEWNEQFAADCTKIDFLRENAKRIVDAFPKTREALKKLGYDPAVLDVPVTDEKTLGRYVDSLFNSCVPLPQKVHTGTVTSKDTFSCGIHNYPNPAWGMNFIHRADFQPFVALEGGGVAHVAPVAHVGSADRSVRVLGVHGVDSTHPLRRQHHEAESGGNALVLEPHDPIAQAAFSG